MDKPKGFFELKTPQDLFRKMEHDFARMEAAVLDSLAAFDFFVTAEHMVDWIHLGHATKPIKTTERGNNIILQVCSQLANGAKHFVPYQDQHDKIKDLESRPGAFSPAFSQGFPVAGLIVHLDGDAEADLGPSIFALELAEKILDHWRQRLAQEPPSP